MGLHDTCFPLRRHLNAVQVEEVLLYRIILCLSEDEFSFESISSNSYPQKASAPIFSEF